MLIKTNKIIEVPLNRQLSFGLDDITRQEIFAPNICHLGFLKSKGEGIYHFSIDAIKGRDLMAFDIDKNKAHFALALKALDYDYNLKDEYEIIN